METSLIFYRVRVCRGGDYDDIVHFPAPLSNEWQGNPPFCTTGLARIVSTTVASASLQAFENHLLTVTYCFLLLEWFLDSRCGLRQGVLWWGDELNLLHIQSWYFWETRMSFQLLLALFWWLVPSGALFTSGHFCHRHILGANCVMQSTANAGRHQKILLLCPRIDHLLRFCSSAGMKGGCASDLAIAIRLRPCPC